MNSVKIKVIDSILESNEGLALTHVVNKTNLPKTTTYRALENLVTEKVLYKNNSQYLLGPVMLRWLNTAPPTERYITILQPYLQELSDHTSQTIHLVRRQGHYGVYIKKLNAKSAIQTKSKIGHELELYSTGAGKALLMNFSPKELDNYFSNTQLVAFTSNTIVDTQKLKQELLQLKKLGYALEIEQNEKHIQCVGVAFKWGSIDLAISITTTSLTSVQDLKKMGVYLKNCQKRIAKALNI